MWAALQQLEPVGYPWISLGMGGAIAALVISLWRQERKESQDRYAALAEESMKRYALMAGEFRTIVQDNTKALTELGDKLGNQEQACAVASMLMELIRSGKKVNIEP